MLRARALPQKAAPLRPTVARLALRNKSVCRPDGRLFAYKFVASTLLSQRCQRTACLPQPHKRNFYSVVPYDGIFVGFIVVLFPQKRGSQAAAVETRLARLVCIPSDNDTATSLAHPPSHKTAHTQTRLSMRGQLAFARRIPGPEPSVSPLPIQRGG